MPTPYEQELLEMSRRANAVETPKGPQLPDLDPRMFLSSAGSFELQAAEQLSAPNIVERLTSEARQHILAQTERVVTASLAQPQPPSLESLFMASALRETGRDAMDAFALAIETVSEAPGFDIAYDLDLDTESGGARGVPNEAVRFQIGRESPPAQTFSTNRIPTSGEVVSRIGSSGRFESVGSRPTISRAEAVARQQPQDPVYVPAYVAPPVPRMPPPIRYEAPAPSALDIISGDSYDNL